MERLIALIGCLLALAAPAFAQVCDAGLAGRPADVAGYVGRASACLEAPPEGFEFDAGMEAGFLARVNAERRAAGLPPVALRPELRPAARFHSLDMAVNSFFGHEGPDGRSGDDRIAALDRTALADFSAENVATVSKTPGRIDPDFALRRLHENLMDSPGHRENILHPKATHVAFGVVRTRSGVWVTQLFLRLSGTLPEAAPLRLSGTSRLRAPRGLEGWKFVRFDLVNGDGLEIPAVNLTGVKGDARLAAYATQPGEDALSFYWIRFLGPAVTVTP
ncbi:MAG: CAP domain-containing protein [Acidobacteria bacterium]|nr:CAP domain-containing protein [Acidobacteriota bacterium]